MHSKRHLESGNRQFGLGRNLRERIRSLIERDLSRDEFKKALVFLVLFGLIIRISFFIEHAGTPSFGIPTLDQKYYDMVARMLLAGDDLRELRGFRPLLYPMFLAVFYKLGGQWGIDLAIFAQHLLGVATAVIVALLGARLFRNRLSGIVGGVLFLLAPVPLYFEGELLIEPSYTFLICLALLLHLRATETGGRKSLVLWFLCGSLVVLIAQARANILVFLAVYPAFAAWRWWQLRRYAEAGKVIVPAPGTLRASFTAVPLVGLAGAMAMAIPWGFVNLKQSEHFHLLPNAGGVALYLGNKRTADGMVPEQERRILSGERYEDSIEVWAREEYEAAMRAQGLQPDTDPMAISKYWTRRTIEEIKAAPASWLRLMARKTLLTFWNVEIPNNKAFAFLKEEYIWLRILPVRWVVLLMLAPAGVWWSWRRGSRNSLFLLLLYALLYSAANIAFFICDRYRYPVWPVMAVIAGGGLLALFEAIRTQKFRTTMAFAAGASGMALLSLHNWCGMVLPSFSRDYMFRSIAWYEKGRYEEALRDIDRSIDLDAREATIVHHRGNVLLALNQPEEAKQAYEEALKLSPGEGAIWNNLGATFQTLGRTADALASFHRAVKCSPPSLKAFLGIAMIEIRAGHLEPAMEALAELEKRERSPNAAVLALRSLIARKRGQTQEAQSLERQARSLDPDATTWAIQEATSGT